MHRHGITYTDTEKDRTFSLTRMTTYLRWCGNKNKNIYQDINTQRVAIDQRFLLNVPQWKALMYSEFLEFLDY